MKRVLYTIPAVMVVSFYSMLALLAGGFASFQPRAWLMMIMPAASAVLLLAGRWWGCIPGMCLGGLLISAGMAGGSMAAMIFGGAVFTYYLVMGILCLQDARKKNS